MISKLLHALSSARSSFVPDLCPGEGFRVRFSSRRSPSTYPLVVKHGALENHRKMQVLLGKSWKINGKSQGNAGVTRKIILTQGFSSTPSLTTEG
jgi:hypothetical protein